MFLPVTGDLPFPRGKTAAQGLVTPDGTYAAEHEGKFFWHNDTVHSTSVPVVLLCVRNTSGSAITVARKFAEFDTTTAKSVGSAIDTFPCGTAGGVCAPLDDAMTVGDSIPDDDLFYVVVSGFVAVLTDSSVANLAAGSSVTSTSAGLVADKANAAAGEFVVGRLDYASSYSADTATRILASLASLTKPPAA